MAFRTFDRIDVPEGEQAMALYRQAFPKAGRKPDPIIYAMFAKGISRLHTENDGDEVIAMAITGQVPEAKWLIVDYLAVREDLRGQGIGRRFVRDLELWARMGGERSGLLLEAEADPGPANEERIRFWESCGFIPTDYVHPYIWVPETYRAMVLPFDSDFRLKDRGESLFRIIESFHKKAFSR